MKLCTFKVDTTGYIVAQFGNDQVTPIAVMSPPPNSPIDGTLEFDFVTKTIKIITGDELRKLQLDKGLSLSEFAMLLR